MLIYLTQIRVIIIICSLNKNNSDTLHSAPHAKLTSTIVRPCVCDGWSAGEKISDGSPLDTAPGVVSEGFVLESKPEGNVRVVDARIQHGERGVRKLARGDLTPQPPRAAVVDRKLDPSVHAFERAGLRCAGERV